MNETEENIGRIRFCNASIDNFHHALTACLKGSEPYVNKTTAQAVEMFKQEPQVQLPRPFGWLDREEKWKIRFYADKLPRVTSRVNCCAHLYQIAAKFSVSLATVNTYRRYVGC